MDNRNIDAEAKLLVILMILLLVVQVGWMFSINKHIKSIREQLTRIESTVKANNSNQDVVIKKLCDLTYEEVIMVENDESATEETGRRYR